MPPENNQPNPQAPSGNDLPQPVGPPAPAPQSQPVPSPYPEAPPSAVPPLHPTNIQQDFPAPDKPAEEENRYAFFMESKPKSAKSLLPNKSNKFAWIVISAVGFFLVLGVLAVFLSARQSNNASQTDSLTNVVHQQQEIIRINTLALPNLRSTDLANFEATATVTTSSSQQNLIDYIDKRGGDINPKDLAKYQADPNTDKVLASALAASVYDNTYKRIMLEMVTEYQSRLKRISDNATMQSEKEIVDQTLNNATLLRTMLEQS